MSPAIKVEAASLLTPYGLGLNLNFKALLEQKQKLQTFNTEAWPKKIRHLLDQEDKAAQACFMPFHKSDLEKTYWGGSQILQDLNLEKASRLGLVITTTKFHSEDFIWNKAQNIEDEINNVKNLFLDISPAQKIYMVSNACSSGIVAIKLACKLLEQNIHDKVLVLSYDFIGPFVYSGFLSLGALAKSTCSPFAKDRDGLHLGEAFAAVLLSKEGPVDLYSCDFINDGASTIRPSHAAKILPKIYENLHFKSLPDLALFHGTGTKHNDAVELSVAKKSFTHSAFKFTSTKGCFGHTLSSSSLVDLAMAYQILMTQDVFGIMSPKEKLEEYAAKHAVTENLTEQHITQILIQSLGFGGISGGVILKKESLYV